MTDFATAAADRCSFAAAGRAAEDCGSRLTVLAGAFRALGSPLGTALGAALEALVALACGKASNARSAFFRACFAAFFQCFDSLRACLSRVLAARTSCFAARAWAAARSASLLSRCAAAPKVDRGANEREIATLLPSSKSLSRELSVSALRCHETAGENSTEGPGTRTRECRRSPSGTRRAPLDNRATRSGNPGARGNRATPYPRRWAASHRPGRGP
jgi:hypothetical protein